MRIIQYNQELGIEQPYDPDEAAIKAAARNGFQPSVEIVKTYSGGRHYIRLEALGEAQSDTRIKPDGTRVQTNMLPEVWDVIPEAVRITYLGGEYLERATAPKRPAVATADDKKAQAK